MKKNEIACAVEAYCNSEGIPFLRHEEEGQDMAFISDIRGLKDGDLFRVVILVNDESIASTTSTPLNVPKSFFGYEELKFLRKIDQVNQAIRFVSFHTMRGKLCASLAYPSSVLDLPNGKSFIHLLYHLPVAVYYKNFSADALPR